MKKLALFLSVLLVLSISFAGCGSDKKAVSSKNEMAASDAAVGENIVNPMVESTKAELKEKYGFDFKVPEKAKNVKYFIVNNTFGEMQFKLGKISLTARQQKCDAFEDISGMNFNKYDKEKSIKLGKIDAGYKRVTDNGTTYDICLWYNEITGIMHSLTAESPDLKDFDIKSVAEKVCSLID